MKKIKLNGQKYFFDAPDEMPLLWVLRDILDLKGTKYGCGKGLCGACTVLIDGQATRSCITPVGSLSGKKVETIDGLARDGEHILQQAWKKFNVPQCGYCQPGQIMNAAGLLNNKTELSEEDINNGMSGNLCRCGTYPRIKAAIKWASNNRNKA